MKFKYILFSLFCFLLINSCTEKKRKLNDEDILTQEEMVAVLFDVHMYDAMVFSNEMSNNTKIRLSSEYYDSAVFAKHECTDSIFHKSIAYYTLEGQIQTIYDAVIDSLNVLNLVNEHRDNANRKIENSDN